VELTRSGGPPQGAARYVDMCEPMNRTFTTDASVPIPPELQPALRSLQTVHEAAVKGRLPRSLKYLPPWDCIRYCQKEGREPPPLALYKGDG
jgi:hypothetical protein